MVIAWIVVVLVVAFVAVVVTHRPGRKAKPGSTPSNGDTPNWIGGTGQGHSHHHHHHDSSGHGGFDGGHGGGDGGGH